MSRSKFVFKGLEELKAEMKTFPADLAGEASHIVEGAANAAATDIKQGYASHRVTGDLQDGVYVSHPSKGQLVPAAVVKNTSPLAWIFENGSEARHYISVNGVKHETGRMPPGHVFLPRIIKWRRVMNEELKALVARKGLQVSGDA